MMGHQVYSSYSSSYSSPRALFFVDLSWRTLTKLPKRSTATADAAGGGTPLRRPLKLPTLDPNEGGCSGELSLALAWSNVVLPHR